MSPALVLGLLNMQKIIITEIQSYFSKFWKFIELYLSTYVQGNFTNDVVFQNMKQIRVMDRKYFGLVFGVGSQEY